MTTINQITDLLLIFASIQYLYYVHNDLGVYKNERKNKQNGWQDTLIPVILWYLTIFDSEMIGIFYSSNPF